MGIMEEYEKAKEKGKVERLTRQIFTWSEEKEVLVGKCLKIEPFTGGKFDSVANCYIIETEYGIVSTVLGTATDKQLEKTPVTGRNVCIEYLGKKELEAGQHCNLFNVDVF